MTLRLKAKMKCAYSSATVALKAIVNHQIYELQVPYTDITKHQVMLDMAELIPDPYKKVVHLFDKKLDKVPFGGISMPNPENSLAAFQANHWLQTKPIQYIVVDSDTSAKASVEGFYAHEKNTLGKIGKYTTQLGMDMLTKHLEDLNTMKKHYKVNPKPVR